MSVRHAQSDRPVCALPSVAERVLSPLHLELLMVVSCHVAAGNQTRVFCKTGSALNLKLILRLQIVALFDVPFKLLHTQEKCSTAFSVPALDIVPLPRL